MDTVVVLAGLSPLGKPLSSETVHRPDEYTRLSGLSSGEIIDTQALARVLVDLARERDRVRTVGERCAEYAQRACSYAVTARSLVQWCANPQRAERSDEKRLRVALASEPRALSGLLEAYLAEIPPHRLANRSVRWLWRRFARARRESGHRT